MRIRRQKWKPFVKILDDIRTGTTSRAQQISACCGYDFDSFHTHISNYKAKMSTSSTLVSSYQNPSFCNGKADFRKVNSDNRNMIQSYLLPPGTSNTNPVFSHANFLVVCNVFPGLFLGGGFGESPVCSPVSADPALYDGLFTTSVLGRSWMPSSSVAGLPDPWEMMSTWGT